MKEVIHVALSADNHYAKHLAVTVVSVLCNKAKDDKLAFHILDGGINQENRNKIEAMVAECGSFIEFLPIDQTLFSGKVLNITEKNHVTVAAYYRLLIPSLIESDRCIYMDCDMICRASLASVWDVDLGKCIAGAVKDIDEDKQAARLALNRYFNSGFLVMDLKAMREENTQEQFFRFIEEQHARIVMHDQDVLNCVLHGRIFELDMKWNCQLCKTHKCKEAGFHEIHRVANVLHFIGRRKPWIRGCRAPSKEEYWKYLGKTPWRMSFYEKIILAFNLISALWKR